MGKMKELYNKYAEEWDTHDCRRGDPDDGCFCELYVDFEQYANERLMQDMQDLTDEEEEDCDCDDCDEDCDDDEDCDGCDGSCSSKPVQTWTGLNNQPPVSGQPWTGIQSNSSDPADPPTWQSLNSNSTDPDDENTVPIDLKKLDLEIQELDGFTMREPNEMDKLKSGNAGKLAGQQCWRCQGRLQQLGNSDPFCGKCELELEKK